MGLILVLAALAVPVLADGDIGLVRASSSPGGALIYIDDVYRGVTPMGQGQSPAIEVTASTTHTIRLVKQGYQDFATTFSVDAGQLRDVTGTLPPATQTSTFGTITVLSNPSGASVYIDGTFYGTTPAAGGSPVTQSVLAGKHRVSVQLDGYDTYSTTVDVASGQTQNVVATLNSGQPNGAILVTAVPSGATITLDGMDPRTSPASYTDVTPGMHMVVATLDGYDPLPRSVQVNSGQTAQATLTLNRVSPSVGAVHITSVPSTADIYLDGAYRGSTPLTIGNLATGSHAVILRRSGYQEYSTTVTISANSVTELPVTLAVQPSTTGSVDVVSYPASAAVYLDGAYQGQTNPWDALDLPGVTPGDHDVTLALGGYYDYVTTVTVTAGRVANVVATLKDQPGANPNGQVAVVSSPSGAAVYIDNVYRGLTPQTMSAVPIGSHTLLIREPGYQDWATSVQVTEGQTAQVSAALVTGGTPTATATLTTAATTAAPTSTTAVPTTTRSGLVDGLALAGVALAGLLVLRVRP
ncbi:MAG: PEGA domain-containing protein [Methanospirillum sp.]